jgi:ferredoxin
VYQAADDGYNAEAGKTVEVPAQLEESAREGAMACPESAILVMD